MLKKFWDWYEKHTTLNTGIAASLFTLQLVHLYWLTTDVVLLRITGNSYFNPTAWFQSLIFIVDYLEIPAIMSTSLLYLNELRKKFSFKNLWFLLFINSQWLHIYWITDEFVIEHFFNHQPGTIIPFWLAWIAIFIDYLELPVIYDTIRRFVTSFNKSGAAAALEKLKEE